jgi:hypothetical protein
MVKNIVDVYNNFSDLTGQLQDKPNEAGRKLSGKVDHSRSETPPRPNARHFPDPRSDRAIAWVNALTQPFPV